MYVCMYVHICVREGIIHIYNVSYIYIYVYIYICMYI